MAHSDGSRTWHDDERLCSSRDSNDSTIPSFRYEKYSRYTPYVREGKTEERGKRYTFTILAKFFLFCTAMILFCVLMYIPVYNKANNQIAKALVAGWSTRTNRDTKIYVQPNNYTTIHEPNDICHKDKHKLFLLIVVCSSTVNFDRRIAIRDTWGNYKKYQEMSKLSSKIREKYKKYNITFDLYSESESTLNVSDAMRREKRDISSFSRLLPELAKALQSNLVDVKTAHESVPEKRFEDEMLPEFDMNKELGDQSEEYDIQYDTNVMKIPPKGYEDSPDLEKILTMLQRDKNFPKIRESLEKSNTEVDFKLVFILGLPSSENNTEVQSKIESEVEKYGDILQEDFIDSYNNLTLKSIMMLKWINNKCNDSVRYILKTDDDMYINVPNLVANLRNRSRVHDLKAAKGQKGKEYLLIGDLICGARPVLDSSNKWYSPRYMYGGRVYPRYLSGTGYALSYPTASALYAAALRTNYFHLEDIYITGMCAVRASPRLVPRDDPAFSYAAGRGRARGRARGRGRGLGRGRGRARALGAACDAHAHATAHRVPPTLMRAVADLLRDENVVDKCERVRLTEVRKELLRPKAPAKRLTKHYHLLTFYHTSNIY